MQRSEYKAIATHPLRDLFRSAAAIEPPTKSQIAAAAAEAGLGDHADEIVRTCKNIADKRRQGVKPFQLNQAVDEVTLTWVKHLRASDNLHGEHGLEPDNRPDDDAAAAADFANFEPLADRTPR